MSMAEIIFSGEVLSIGGDCSGDSLSGVMPELNSILRRSRISRLDPSGIEVIDGAGVALWEEIVARVSRQGAVLIEAARPEVAEVMEIFSSAGLSEEPVPKPVGFYERLGDILITGFRDFGVGIVLASEIMWWSVAGILDRHAQRKGVLAQQCVILGQNAVPIIALLSFIIGFILSLQAAAQLKNYGAGVFLADILAISVIRELGPLITAILIAGRSGSAIASEIGTMRVSEELDALRMMALNPIRYVVVPKFHALTLMMPLLVTISIFLAELGGALVSVGYLDISVMNFLRRSVEVTTSTDLLITYLKSTVFAWLIVVVGAHYGFRVRGGAEGVGRATTAAVVTSIFAVIIVDALFSLFYL